MCGVEKILYFASISCSAVVIVPRTQSQVRQVNWSYIVHGNHDDVITCAPAKPRKILVLKNQQFVSVRRCSA